jgi:hypothetical protein
MLLQRTMMCYGHPAKRRALQLPLALPERLA